MSFHAPHPFPLVSPAQLHSLVEHRSRFTLDHCELNVFETREKAERFYLSFEGFTVTSMLRGRKIMHLDGFEEFEYVPGETVLAPVGSSMTIDFPDASLDSPTQCTALVLDPAYLRQQLDRINERRAGSMAPHGDWALDPREIFLRNNTALAQVSTRMLQVFTSDDPLKDLQAEVILQEMVLSLLRLQYQKEVQRDAHSHPNAHPFAAVLEFIRTHLTDPIQIGQLCRIANMSKSQFYRLFTDCLGMTPLQMIQQQRLDSAKELLRQPEIHIKEIAYAVGFNDPNYFSRIFKKQEGLSPGAYRKKFRQKGTKKVAFRD